MNWGTACYRVFQNLPSSLLSSENMKVKIYINIISLFHRAFQFTMVNGPTNALFCNKTLIQMSHTKTLKITPKCFDHQMVIIREI
jgi:hypothetical protein